MSSNAGTAVWHVLGNLESVLFQRQCLGGDHHRLAPFARATAQHHRPETVWIAECEQTVLGRHDCGERPRHPFLGFGNGLEEDLLLFGRGIQASIVLHPQAEDPEQCLAITVGGQRL
jgi:hypothetical protein